VLLMLPAAASKGVCVCVCECCVCRRVIFKIDLLLLFWHCSEEAEEAACFCVFAHGVVFSHLFLVLRAGLRCVHILG
jgi:hypothetical protein